jgi:hypothetical protein
MGGTHQSKITNDTYRLLCNVGKNSQKTTEKKLESKLQEGKQCVKTSRMHSMYYKKFADYTKVLGTILNVGNFLLREKTILFTSST